MTNPQTPAGRLATSFGRPEEMAVMYAPDVTWHLPRGLAQEPLIGKDAVRAFNQAVWSLSYRPECQIDLLDEVGDERMSAVRFRYRAHMVATDQEYENEYTLFVRADDEGIHEVFEAMDTVRLLDSLRGDPLGASFTRYITQGT